MYMCCYGCDPVMWYGHQQLQLWIHQCKVGLSESFYGFMADKLSRCYRLWHILSIITSLSQKGLLDNRRNLRNHEGKQISIIPLVFYVIFGQILQNLNFQPSSVLPWWWLHRDLCAELNPTIPILLWFRAILLESCEDHINHFVQSSRCYSEFWYL